MKFQIPAIMLASCVATVAMASPQIKHIFEPGTSETFSVDSTVSQNMSLKDTKGNAVTLTTSNQLLPVGMSTAGLSANDANALGVGGIKVDFNSKTNQSYVELSGSKLSNGTKEAVDFYMPAKIQIDSQMYITGLSSGLSATADQTGQGVAASLSMSPGSPYHVDTTSTQSCTYDVTVQDGQDCTRVIEKDKDGKTEHVRDRCEPHYTTTTYYGNQSCERVGDTWSDTYTFTLGNNSAAFVFQQDYDNIQNNCTPCQ